jgi:hypothetical protein
MLRVDGHVGELEKTGGLVLDKTGGFKPWGLQSAPVILGGGSVNVLTQFF